MEASSQPPALASGGSDAASPDTETLLPPRTRNTGNSRILRLPAVLQELILQAALVHPSAFKKLLLVCRSWAAAIPSLPCHLQVREGAQVQGDKLAKGMAQLSRVVSLRLPRGSVYGSVPTTYYPRTTAAEEAADPPMPWTTNLKALALDCVEFQTCDVSWDFPNLKELTHNFESDVDVDEDEDEDEDEHEDYADVGRWVPWVSEGFPPALLRLKCSHWKSPNRSPYWTPSPSSHGFPSTLVSLHMESMGDHYVRTLGDLSRLKKLIIDVAPSWSFPSPSETSSS